MAVDDAPSLVVLRSHIGHPSPDLTDDAAAQLCGHMIGTFDRTGVVNQDDTAWYIFDGFVDENGR